MEEQFSGFYPFDIYFPSTSLVVEINGPTHYYDLTDKLLPKFVLKKRIFENAFINYLDLNYQECLNENREVKAQYVIDKINRAL